MKIRVTYEAIPHIPPIKPIYAARSATGVISERMRIAPDMIPAAPLQKQKN